MRNIWNINPYLEIVLFEAFSKFPELVRTPELVKISSLCFLYLEIWGFLYVN